MAAVAAVAATEMSAAARGARPIRGRRAVRSGPDRATVVLFSLAAFLVVLAMLASQLRVTAAPAQQRRVLVIRRIYRTTIVETVIGPGRGTSMSQSISSSGSSNAYPTAATPTTRSSPSH
jgi:hypothetical protein